MIEHFEWETPHIDEVRTVRHQILDAMSASPAQTDCTFETALSELLTNAAEASTEAERETVLIEVHDTHVTVTNHSSTEVPDVAVPPADAIRGRGLAFVAALWPQTSWLASDGQITARMELR